MCLICDPYLENISLLSTLVRNISVIRMRMSILFSIILSVLAFNKIQGKYLLVELQSDVQPPGKNGTSPLYKEYFANNMPLRMTASKL